MQIYFPSSKKIIVLALGAESAGNFSVFREKKIYLSRDFGDLLKEKNWRRYQMVVLEFLKKNKLKPDIILADLHPLFQTTLWGKELAQKYKARFIQIQHHHAHIFSAVGDRFADDSSYILPNIFYGIACDGTGYGEDGKIWGGEVFAIRSQKTKSKNQKILRIGHLENQLMTSGDLSVREPARMLIGILYKFLDKNKIYFLVKKYYRQNQFELIYNQLTQNFNCLETSSAGRVLDAVSILLSFCGNKRKYKHAPIEKLEKNSTVPYLDLKTEIIFDAQEKMHILRTTPLFEYLLQNIGRDKKRLAATAQLYIAEGLYEIISKSQKTKNKKRNNIFISGGIANNKIISEYLISKGAYVKKNIHPVKSGQTFNNVPRGDAGLSFGQIIYYLSANSRN